MRAAVRTPGALVWNESEKHIMHTKNECSTNEFAEPAAAAVGPAATDSYGVERGPRGVAYQVTTLAMSLAFLLFAFGCLVTSGRNIQECGTRVSSSTMDQVRVGETTEEWLLATLGEPTSRRSVSGQGGDGASGGPRVEILRYEHVRREEKGGAVFLLFADRTETEHRTVTYFEVTDGVVTRCWTET